MLMTLYDSANNYDDGDSNDDDDDDDGVKYDGD